MASKFTNVSLDTGSAKVVALVTVVTTSHSDLPATTRSSLSKQARALRAACLVGDLALVEEVASITDDLFLSVLSALDKDESGYAVTKRGLELGRKRIEAIVKSARHNI